jgi:hypothetical protein
LSTFCQLFYNFLYNFLTICLATFWQLFWQLFQNFLATFLTIFDNFLTIFWQPYFLENFFTTTQQLFWPFFILMVLASCGDKYYRTNFISAVPTSLLIAPGLRTIQFLLSTQVNTALNYRQRRKLFRKRVWQQFGQLHKGYFMSLLICHANLELASFWWLCSCSQEYNYN